MKTKPAVPILLALFFAVATGILVVAGLALTVPGTPADLIWSPLPSRRGMLMPYRQWMGPAFLGLALVMAAASLGCLRRRKWGWRLALAIFAVNGFGDLAQLALGHVLEGAVGVTVAALILFALTRPRVKSAFA